MFEKRKLAKERLAFDNINNACCWIESLHHSCLMHNVC